MQNNSYALLSVTDKSGIVELATELISLGYKIISTGGTAATLKNANLPIIDIANFTGSPEILEGRVKTLHPKVHAGILMNRDSSLHEKEMLRQGLDLIDLVVVNLYRFSELAVKQALELDEAIEFIDVGGPTMLRAAAKNHRFCLPVIDPADYPLVIEELKKGTLNLERRRELARKVFEHTYLYDKAIFEYFTQSSDSQELKNPLSISLKKKSDLRYGENPQQKAAIYSSKDSQSGLCAAQLLQGKELSYNNYLDLDAAVALSRQLKEPNVVIVKHTNPCGVAQAERGTPLLEIWQKALECDSKSAFGGIVASNQTIDVATAQAMMELFLECIVAPDISADARAVFEKKKNLRILLLEDLKSFSEDEPGELQIRSILGGLLVQTADQKGLSEWKCVSTKSADSTQMTDLEFAWLVCKHVKSNAIVFAKDQQAIAIGAGQVSRVDAVKFAIEKAREHGHSLDASVVASDAFFPFRDSIDTLAKVGVSAIVQPGGSVRDEESILACEEHKLSMYFTGTRHFKH